MTHAGDATGIIDVVAGECAQVSDAVAGLSEEDFTLPTRCPPWSVKVLLAHMWRDMYRLRTGLAEPPPAEADTTAVMYWRSYDPVADAPDISDRAQKIASGFATGSALARSFERNWRAATEAARREQLGRVMGTWGPALPPPSLGWGDIAFIETGTGRRRLTDPERSILGESCARFPLLA